MKKAKIQCNSSFIFFGEETRNLRNEIVNNAKSLSLSLSHPHTHRYIFNRNWIKIANQTHAPIPYLPHKISRNDREDTFNKFKKSPRKTRKTAINKPGMLRKQNTGLSWWLSGKESTCQRRRHRFDPWAGKVPHATSN